MVQALYYKLEGRRFEFDQAIEVFGFRNPSKGTRPWGLLSL
jgi:hypothetical protein